MSRLRVLLVMAVLSGGAQAQPPIGFPAFPDQPTCYSWNGGHMSAGSFSKCPPEFLIVQVQQPAPLLPEIPPLTTPPAPVVVPAPVVECPAPAPIEPPKPKPKRRHIVPQPKC